LPIGRHRLLTDAEIKELNKLIEPSSKTEEASLPKPAPRIILPRKDFRRN
jgi:23S rRNA pseudouridine2604 synthase